jgi:hypothetical protein
MKGESSTRTAFPNSRFMDFHKLAVYPAFSFCFCKWVYCSETAQISSHTILSQTGLWNLFIKIISKLLANSMVTMLCALLNTFPEQWGTKRTCDTLFVGTCQHWCQSNSLSQMKIQSTNYRNSKCGKQKQNTWQAFPNRIRIAFGSDTRVRIVDQSPPYI